MVTYLKQICLTVIQIVEGIWRGLRFLWAVFVLVFTAFLVTDLFSIPVSVNRSYEYAPEKALWEKKDPHNPAVIEEAKKLKEQQEHCRHIFVQRNGLVTYYCPLCRKKLTRATPPIWQV